MDQTNRVDASLMILTVMSYLLTKRNDLIMKLEDMLHKNEEYFANSGIIV